MSSALRRSIRDASAIRSNPGRSGPGEHLPAFLLYKVLDHFLQPGHQRVHLLGILDHGDQVAGFMVFLLGLIHQLVVARDLAQCRIEDFLLDNGMHRQLDANGLCQVRFSRLIAAGRPVFAEQALDLFIVALEQGTGVFLGMEYSAGVRRSREATPQPAGRTTSSNRRSCSHLPTARLFPAYVGLQQLDSAGRAAPADLPASSSRWHLTIGPAGGGPDGRYR